MPEPVAPSWSRGSSNARIRSACTGAARSSWRSGCSTGRSRGACSAAARRRSSRTSTVHASARRGSVASIAIATSSTATCRGTRPPTTICSASGWAFHRGDDLAVLADQRALAPAREGRLRGRSAEAERARRRQPRAGAVLPPRGRRHDAARRPRARGRVARLLHRVLAATRGHARLHRSRPWMPRATCR